MDPFTITMSIPAIHYPDCPGSPAYRPSGAPRLSNKRSQPHMHVQQHHAYRKTSAFSTRRQNNVSGSQSHRQRNASGTRRQHNVSGTRRYNNVSGTYSRHRNASGPPPPPPIHTHIPQPRRRHTSLMKPFMVRTPRTPPSSPMLARTPMLPPPPRPWTPLSITDDAMSVRSGSRPCSPSSGVSSNPKLQRRTLRHAVRSLLSNIMRRQREDIDEESDDEPPLLGLRGGAPLRPHRSPGAESFHATSGRVALEPTRSSSPPVRMSAAADEHGSPVRPHLIVRPRTRRLNDRLVSRFSDSSADSESDGVSIFSLGKHTKPVQMHPLMRGRKWSSAPSLSRGALRALSVAQAPGRRGKSLDL